MGQFFSSLKKHLNSWDEISLDKTLRLRTSVLIFTFVISCISLIPTVIMIVDFGIAEALPTLAFVLISISLFCRQFFNPAYSVSNAWIFVVLGLGMAAFLIWTGGVAGTGVLWIYVIPVIAAMVLSLRGILIYDCILMVTILTLLHTPLRGFMPFDYSTHMRISIPLSLLLVIICSYMTELARHNTHKKLAVASGKLQESALTDPLTSIYNRRALEVHFGDIDEKRPGLAFAMLDLDYFKKVNDNYGHDVGDKVLRHVVKITRESIPSDAHLYRWGGEEFLLVLKTGDPDEFEKELNCLREKIEKNPLVFDEGLHATIKITVSIGGACPDKDLTIGECIRFADINLYKAKERGRNMVVVQ